jgi:hypothetical protein
MTDLCPHSERMRMIQKLDGLVAREKTDALRRRGSRPSTQIPFTEELFEMRCPLQRLRPPL